MPNIFSGIQKMSDDELRIQTALLKKVTFGSAVKETGIRAIGRLLDMANAVASTVSENAKIEYKIKGIAEEVSLAADEMRKMKRAELLQALKEQIADKCNELIPGSVKEETSEDAVSIFVISEAAIIFGLDKCMTPAGKAQAVSEKYLQTYLNRLHKILQKEDAAEIENTDKQIQIHLNNVSMEQKRDLYKKVMPKDFSGKGFGRILRKESGTKYLTQISETIGTQFYDSRDVNIFTVYDLMRSVNRIQRALFAQLVHSCVKSYGKKFTVSRDILPSFIPADRMEEETEKERQFMEILAKKSELEETIQKVNASIESIQIILWENEEKIRLETEALQEAAIEMDALEQQKDKYGEDSVKTQEETRQFFKSVNTAARKLEYAKKSYEKRTEVIQSSKSELAEKCLIIERSEKEYAEVKEEAEGLVKKYADVAKRMWGAYFYKFVFSIDLFDYLVNDFTKSEILRIEEFLKEIHDSADYNAYGIAATDIFGNSVIKATCVVTQGKNAYITYSGRNMIRISRKEGVN